jgi:hypothetical protein
VRAVHCRCWHAPVGSVKRFKSSSNEQYFGELIGFHEWMMGFVTGFNALCSGDYSRLTAACRAFSTDH